jgi:hypothetical protein
LNNPFSRFVHDQQMVVLVEDLRRMQVVTPIRSCAKRSPVYQRRFRSTSRLGFQPHGQRLSRRGSRSGWYRFGSFASVLQI